MKKLDPTEKRDGGTASLFKRYWWVGLLVLPLALGYLFWLEFFGASSVATFVFGPGASLKKDEGRINVLLLGMAGGKHDGATLTDTIMVASYDPKQKQVDLISLPRDLWLSDHRAKVNTLYQTGLAKGLGLKFARDEVGKILGIEIPYAIRVDFGGFVKAVDLVEGIDVEVGRSFDDYKYPIEGKERDLCGYIEEEIEVNEEQSKVLNIPQGKQKVLKSPTGEIATDSAKLDFPCRFEHIGFKRGVVLMDGETALKFSRSRSGTNQEGTDFARSKRQQQVLQAFLKKALSIDTLTDPPKIVGLIQTFGESVATDIPQNKYLEFVRISRNVDRLKSHVFGTAGPRPLLVTPTTADFGGAWVLVPADNDFGKIKQHVEDIFAGRLESSESAKAGP